MMDLIIIIIRKKVIFHHKVLKLETYHSKVPIKEFTAPNLIYSWICHY
jgi:hypothetical protein